MCTQVAIPTPDGEARAYFFHPGGAGPWPAVIFYMDAPAIRPALFQMCERLAGHGYAVLLPDMFWRAGPYEPIDLKVAFRDEATRREIFGKLMASTDPARAMRDTGACLAWLSTRPEVKGDKVGCTGYCMGGGLSLRAAGNFPDRVVAAAAFHGGRLATDEPDSPHLLAPRIKARIYVGGADQDAGSPPNRPTVCARPSTRRGWAIRWRSTPAPATATPRRTCRPMTRRRRKGTGGPC